MNYLNDDDNKYILFVRNYNSYITYSLSLSPKISDAKIFNSIEEIQDILLKPIYLSSNYYNGQLDCELMIISNTIKINNKYHSLRSYARFNINLNIKSYYVIGKYLGETKEEFIKNLSHVLIPKKI